MTVMAPALPFAAYLRIYEPLVAFPEQERERWTAYVARGSVPDPLSAVASEHQATLAAALAVPPLVVPRPDAVDEAFVRVDSRSGSTYVCPWRTVVRSWFALGEFRAGLPDELAAVFVPAAVLDTAENDLEKWVAAHPDLHVHVRTSRWHVPLAWFALVEAGERELVLDDSARRCSYLVTMANARRRAARALAVLRRALADGPLVGQVEDVARWLEEFHPHALVELDYGGLVQLLDDDSLRGDDSPTRLAEALRSLRDDADAAVAACERVAQRWARLRAVETAN
jgi:hypothetical protein